MQSLDKNQVLDLRDFRFCNKPMLFEPLNQILFSYFDKCDQLIVSSAGIEGTNIGIYDGCYGSHLPGNVDRERLFVAIK